MWKVQRASLTALFPSHPSLANSEKGLLLGERPRPLAFGDYTGIAQRDFTFLRLPLSVVYNPQNLLRGWGHGAEARHDSETPESNVILIQ